MALCLSFPAAGVPGMERLGANHLQKGVWQPHGVCARCLGVWLCVVHHLLQQRALGRVACAILAAHAEDLRGHLCKEVQAMSAQ